MKELTAAWAQIRATFPGERASPGPETRTRASGSDREGDLPEVLTDDECLNWFIGTWIEAGPAADDPVSDEDVQRMLEPIAVAARRVRFDAWCRRHARTLSIALAADQVHPGEIPAEWVTYYRQLDEADTDVILLLLLDQVLTDAGLDT